MHARLRTDKETSRGRRPDLRKPFELAEFAWLQREREGRHSGGVGLDERPTRCPLHRDRDTTTGKVLLVLEILVGRDIECEARRLSLSNQHTIRKVRPAPLERRLHDMGGESANSGTGVP